MKPLGQRKYFRKVCGHGHECVVCVPVTRREKRKLSRAVAREAIEQKVSRAREKNQRDPVYVPDPSDNWIQEWGPDEWTGETVYSEMWESGTFRNTRDCRASEFAS